MLAMGVAGHPALLILGLLIYNLGTGFNAAMRSIAIHIVGGQSSPNIGRLMAVIAIMESIGMMIAGPLLNNSFQWAMVLGEPWLGLPFLASALVFGSMTFLMFLISIRNKEFTCVEVDPIESMNSASPHSNNSTLEYRFPQDTSHQRASSS
jgi:MFS family permease